MRFLRVLMVVYSLVASLLLYLSLPNCISRFGFWPLGWVFAIPLFMALPEKNSLQRLKVGFLFGIIFYALIMFWLLPLNGLGYLSLVLVFSTQPIIFCFLYKKIKFSDSQQLFSIERIADLIYVPALWVTTEFLRTLLLGGFSWTIGHSQSFFPLNIQLANVGGVYGISFALILFNYCIYRVIQNYTQSYFYGGVALGLLSVICIYGYFSIVDQLGKEKNKNPLEICAIQPNISTKVKWNQALLDQVVDEHVHLTRECLLKKRPDFIVWPETAIPDDFIKDLSLRRKITQIAHEVKTTLLLGAALYENDRYYNTAVLLNGQGTVLDIYRKKHLIPFSEYLPWGRYLNSLRQIFSLNVVDFYRGESPGIMTLAKRNTRPELGFQKFGVAICSEDGYPELFRKLVQSRAGFVVVMLNDAWFEQKTALALHAQFSIMRAVENGISVVRAANSGWSCSIAPSGHIRSSLTGRDGDFLRTSGVGRFLIFLGTPKTFYNQYGDIFAVFCSGFVIISFMILIIRSKKLKNIAADFMISKKIR